jgi:hypothetical protein
MVGMHSLATPLFEAPDEVWHYAYVRWLAEGHGLPAMDDDASGANQEVAQPPLYYAAAALLSAPFPDDDLMALFWHNPNFGHQAPGTVPDNKNMLIHTAQERWPWRGAVLAVRVARLTSLLFGCLTVAAAWGLGYETFRDRRAALVTAMLVALHPQFVFICGVVSNDSAAAALSTVALWLTARALRRGPSARRVLLLGIGVGLAALTKSSVILLGPLVGLALLVAVWRWMHKGDERRFISVLGRVWLLYGVAALLVGGWWYARNWVRYGDPLGFTSHIDTPWGRSAPVSLLALLPEMPLLLRSFWAAYGWGHVMWPDWVYGVLWGASLLGLGYAAYWIGGRFFAALRMTREEGEILRCAQNDKRRGGFGTLAVLAMAGVWFMLVLAALLHWMRQVAAPHGRLLFPAIGAWAVLLATGLRAKPLGASEVAAATVPTTTGEPEPRAPRVHYRPMQRAFLTFLFAIAALAPGARILATFVPPRLYEPTKVAETVTGPVLAYGEGARLLGVDIAYPSPDFLVRRRSPDRGVIRVTPGETIQVRACWEALRPMQEDYTVFVHLVGPENMRVAERHTYPGLGRFPTSLWPGGRAFCDTYRLRVASWAEGPLRYQVQMGLFDARTGERLPAVTAAGVPLVPPIVGMVDVVPMAGAISLPSHPLSATLGDSVALRGYDGPSRVQPGETLTVTLYWEALRGVDDDFIAFVHLWQPGAPAPIAQDDARPRQGWFPTFAWETGDWVVDPHSLTVPVTLAPGRYPLWAGLYRADNGVRLPAVHAEGRYSYDLVPLGALVISD